MLDGLAGSDELHPWAMHFGKGQQHCQGCQQWSLQQQQDSASAAGHKLMLMLKAFSCYYCCQRRWMHRFALLT